MVSAEGKKAKTTQRTAGCGSISGLPPHVPTTQIANYQAPAPLSREIEEQVSVKHIACKETSREAKRTENLCELSKLGKSQHPLNSFSC
jgi:hypothetical protein